MEPEDDEAKKEFEKILTNANEVILENEKVLDNQTILIALGMLANLFVVFKSQTEFFNLLDTVPLITIFFSLTTIFFSLMTIIFSFITLILCIITPVVFIHKRRKIQDDLVDLLKKEKNYTVDDLDKIEQRRLGFEKIKGIKIHPMEKARLISIILTIGLSAIFYVLQYVIHIFY